MTHAIMDPIPDSMTDTMTALISDTMTDQIIDVKAVSYSCDVSRLWTASGSDWRRKLFSTTFLEKNCTGGRRKLLIWKVLLLFIFVCCLPNALTLFCSNFHTFATWFPKMPCMNFHKFCWFWSFLNFSWNLCTGGLKERLQGHSPGVHHGKYKMSCRDVHFLLLQLILRTCKDRLVPIGPRGEVVLAAIKSLYYSATWLVILLSIFFAIFEVREQCIGVLWSARKRFALILISASV